MHGDAVFTWPDGKRYEGEYRDHKKHGKGKFTWPNGKMYDGDWKEGKQHGSGQYRESKDAPVRSGTWINGRKKKDDN